MEALNFSTVNFSLDWEDLSRDTEAIDLLEKKILPEYLKSCRWFGGKARKLAGISVDNHLSLSSPGPAKSIFHFLILKAKYRTGKSEEYLLPLSLVADAESIPRKGVVANTNHGWLIDAIYDEAFRQTIFIHLFNSEKIKQKNGALIFEKSTTDVVFPTAVGLSESPVKNFSEGFSSHVLDADQSNSSLIYDPLPVFPEGKEASLYGYFLKIYRKLFRETNPDVEMVKFLTEQAHFSYIPPYAGTFFWKKASGAPTTLGMMQQKVTAVKDAWSLAGDYLNEFLFSLSDENIVIPLASIHQAELLGIRTAEMHIALSGTLGDAAFTPEVFNDEYTDWLLDNCESLLKRRLRLTKDCYASLDEAGKELSKFFIGNAARIREYFSRIKKRSFHSKRLRIHGDYHLGQILFDGTDYIILDFEGEPESSIMDRKIKHSALKDVAGIIRSFHYAVSAKLYFSPETKNFSPEKIEAAVAAWYNTVTEVFLNGYRNTMGNNSVLQDDQSELDFLLQFHLLEKAVYELGYELNGRPTWVKIPLKGIQQVLKQIQS